ncbi:multidrug ABC transporter ATPase and permease, partial [Lacticaseibacillus rhamnosus MTCC 5462]
MAATHDHSASPTRNFPLTFGPLLALNNLPGSLLNGFAAAKNLFKLLREQPLNAALPNATQTVTTID